MSFFKDLFRNRGKRVIVCPETQTNEVVRTKVLQPERLSECSRWPEKEGCDEACVSQIIESANGCLVQALAADWYLRKSCVICHRQITAISWLEAPPAVLKEDGTTAEWTDIPLQALPEVFRTGKPLCWYCNNAMELERLRPGLIVKRPVGKESEKEILRSDNVF